MGIDMVEVLLEIVQFYGLEFGIKVVYYCISVEVFVVEYVGSFDVVICMEMLEYVFDLVFVIKVCMDLVKFGGKVFFFILNCNVKFYLLGIVVVEYVL